MCHNNYGNANAIASKILFYGTGHSYGHSNLTESVLCQPASESQVKAVQNPW